MLKKYRITKYNPKYRDENGYYTKEEWTSYADIGEIYEGKSFVKEEYLRVEKMYIVTIMYILKQENVKKMIMKACEKYSIKDTRKYLRKHGLNLSKSDELFLKGIRDGKQIAFGELKRALRLLLRDGFWCILYDPETGCRVQTGYDYYAYMACHSIAPELIHKVEKLGMFIEPYKPGRLGRNV